MTNIVPFETAKVPASLANFFGDGAESELVGTGGGTGFPVISIKGKVFHVVRGDEKTLVTKPGEDDPAGSIEVVILRANPARSKVFYASGYVEGSTDKPTCYSNDGVAPEIDAAEPQSKKCAICPHNQWGSKVTEAGKKGKACADSRRLAVATLDAVSDPMMLRVPAASMKNLEEYGKILAARGLPPQAVVTKVGFDYSVAHPALTFKPVGIISDAELLKEIKRMREEDIVQEIVGLKASHNPAPVEEAEESAPVAAAKQAEPLKTETKPKAESKPKATTKPAVETEEKAATKAAEKSSVAVASLDDDITNMLDQLDFDE